MCSSDLRAEAAAPPVACSIPVATEISPLLGSRPDMPPPVLLERADLVLVLRVKPADDRGVVATEVVRVLKGRQPGKAPAIDTGKAASAEHARAVREMIVANGDGPALFFVGKGEVNEPICKLHLAGKWVSLDKGEAEGAWEVDAIDSQMEATWAGGTDMLLRMLDVAARCPDVSVPVACGGSWDDPVKIGSVEGRVRSAMAVDLAGRGEAALFVASEGGDRVFAFDRKSRKYEDVTGRLKLGSRSSFAAWGDFSGQGRLDLASSDGKRLVIWSQAAGGTFAAISVAEVPKDACTGLAAVDVGRKGLAGLVWGSVGGAVLLVPEAGKPGGFALKPLAAAAGALKDRSGAGAPLVADFDGDGLPDVVIPFAKGGLFYKGRGAGEFAEGAACEVALGSGRTAAFLGDFDMDGRLDIMTVAEDTPRLWQNAGGGRFTNEFALSGEMTYISKPGAIGGNVGDINNDGRPDAFLFYPEMHPQVFFNRGFRSFMQAHRPVDLAETGNLPEAEAGQQAGVLADLDGDGLQDMALVLADGSVRVLTQSPAETAALALCVALAPGAGTAGPVTVTARNGQLPLGARLVSPGQEAFFARSDVGEITIAWQLSGEAPKQKTFTLEDKPVRFVIGAE